MGDKKYRDGDWLRKRLREGATKTEMGEECGVTRTTINNWCERLGVNDTPVWKRTSWLREQIETGATYSEIAERGNVNERHLKTWMDKKGVRELYWEKHDIQKREWEEKVTLPKEKLTELFIHRRLTYEQIANYFDCGYRPVWKNLQEYGLTAKHQPAILETEYKPKANRGGYVRWKDSESKCFYVHRLLAISEYGIEAVKGNEVHHKSIRWDNRPKSIEVLSVKEHRNTEEWPDEEEIHDCPRDPNPKFTDREWLQEAMLRYGSVEKIAEVCDRDTSEIQHWVDWFGIKKHKDPLEA